MLAPRQPGMDGGPTFATGSSGLILMRVSAAMSMPSRTSTGRITASQSSSRTVPGGGLSVHWLATSVTQ